MQCLGLIPEELETREVDFLDIAYDDIKQHHYKEAEDPKFFQSGKTGRGPLVEGWRDTHKPIMCCYKAVHVKFEVWGLQTRVEEFAQSVSISFETVSGPTEREARAVLVSASEKMVSSVRLSFHLSVCPYIHFRSHTQVAFLNCELIRIMTVL